ncbi:hypothetical protein MD484_g5582, partial [Candolleomyces efflorescens]
MVLNYAAPAGSFFQRLLNALTMPYVPWTLHVHLNSTERVN